jgi:hypothetical protein
MLQLIVEQEIIVLSRSDHCSASNVRPFTIPPSIPPYHPILWFPAFRISLVGAHRAIPTA